MFTRLNRVIFSLLVFAATVQAIAADGIFSPDPDTTAVNRTPKLSGVIRPRWELDTRSGESRFQVRNLRLILSGNISKDIDYFVQASGDLGKLSLLDAWGRLKLVGDLQLQAGQFRVPFGTECFRTPANYLFANRSFGGGIMNNVRGTGAKLSYSHKFSRPFSLSVEAAAFNPSAIDDQNIWVKHPAFAGKAVANIHDFKIAAGAETLIPGDVRINSLAASLSWIHDRWIIEAEYLTKHYVNNAFRTAKAYHIHADYHFPIRLGIFKEASVQGRFDGMSAYSTGIKNDEGKLIANYPSRRRATIGGMLYYRHNLFGCYLRLNYEKYFYRNGVAIPSGANDKICAELIFQF